MGGQRVYKTLDRGDHWVPISEDLSTRDTMRLHMSLELSGGITRDVSSAETNGTVVTIGESPIRAGLLYAGTDDGNVLADPQRRRELGESLDAFSRSPRQTLDQPGAAVEVRLRHRLCDVRRPPG